MKQFFEEYGGVIMVLVVVAVLVAMVGTDTKTTSTLAGQVNTALTTSMNNFTSKVNTANGIKE